MRPDDRAMPLSPFALCLCLLLLLAVSVRAQTPAYDHPLFTGPVQRLPAPGYDQEHLRLDLRIDPANREIQARAVLRVRLLDPPLATLELAAQGLEIDSVRLATPAGPMKVAYREAAARLIVPLDSLGEGGQPFEVEISYRARPRHGLRFEETKAGDDQIWTDGLPDTYPHWLPLSPDPSDRLTAQLLVTVPPSMQAPATGRLVRVEETGETKTFQYAVEHPVAPAFLGLVAGAFEGLPERVEGLDRAALPIAYAVPPGRAAEAVRTFEGLAEMVRYLSEKLDVAFPWPHYAHAVVEAYPFEGRAAAGLAILSNRSLLDERAALDEDPDSLLGVLLARQWFGTFVSPASPADRWLTDGLSAYLGALVALRHNSEGQRRLAMQEAADAYLAEAADYRRPLVWSQWRHPADLLDAHGAQKGAWVFHMLHEALGDEAFWTVLNLFLRSHQFSPVTTRDFKFALEAVTEQRFDAFFDQWIFAAGHPVWRVSYDYLEEEKALALTVRQVQDGYLVPTAFAADVPVEVHTLDGVKRFSVKISAREETFSLPLDDDPRFLVIDPDLNLLAEQAVQQPIAAWVAQLRDATEPVSRTQAARALTGFREDPALLIALRNALQSEPMPAVRATLIKTMRQLPRSDALERALLAAYEDESAEVRGAALEALSAFEGSSPVAALAFEAAQTEVSYAAQAAAVLTLARVGAPEALDVARSALITPSHREVVRRAAFAALPFLDVPSAEALTYGLDYSAESQPPEVREAAVRYLGTLATGQRRAHQRLEELMTDPSIPLSLAAAEALGGDSLKEWRSTLEGHLDGEPDPALRARALFLLQEINRRH